MTSPATGILLGGRYRLQDRIASGGMGTVWAAQDETLHRRVAVKVLNEGLSSDDRFTERFRREARDAAGLSHPNIAGVFDYGEEDGRPYIVMELIEGQTLAERTQRVGRLEPEETARVGASVAGALVHAHAAGIVHRDIKPANIMLTASGDVKVMDFGIAAPLAGATGLTATGAVMGTARYISPEQAEGGRATPATDVYSLGVVLYEALAGEPPFVRDTPVATALAHINEPPRPVRDLRPDAPTDLAGTIDRTLEKDPARRPTPSALAAALASGSATAGTSTLPIAVGGDTEALPLAEPTVPVLVPRRRRGFPFRLTTPLGTISPRGSRRSRRLRWLVGAALVAIALVIFAVASGHTRSVRVPNFVSLDKQAAGRQAQHAGVTVVFTPPNGPAGTIVSQRPLAGVLVPDGALVVLVVSSGAPEFSPQPQPSEFTPPGHQPGHGHGNGHQKNGEGD
jgi:serine/threonine-protein kinase